MDQCNMSIHLFNQGIDMNTLFTNTRIGRYTLRNRLVMAPMTRSRADDTTGVPSPMAVDYYSQRAGAGLIITEGTYPAPMGKGYVRTPGIHSDAQIEACHRCSARQGRPHLPAAHAYRSHLSSEPLAERRNAGCAFGRQTRRYGIHRNGTAGVCTTARP